LHYAVEVFKYLNVPKSQDAKAGLLKVTGAFSVMPHGRFLCVLAAVEFND
jgi:hypothetical protein